MEPVYYGHLGTSKKCPDYQGVLIFQVILYEKGSFGTSTKCVDYAGVLTTLTGSTVECNSLQRVLSLESTFSPILLI